MNPELRRNLWLEFSTHRLVAMPAVIGLMVLFVYAVWGAQARAALSVAAASGFLVLVTLWGTQLAGLAVLDEVRERTWDTQRTSAIGPWRMTWGKLLGAPAYPWYGGAFCLAVFIATSSANLPVWVLSGLLVAFSLTLHGVALNASILAGRAGATGRGSGLLVIILGVALLANASPLVADLGGTVGWWGRAFVVERFALASALVFALWAAFGAYRSMCEELQVRTTPWAIVAFLAFLAVYLSGFAPGGSARTMLPLVGLLVSMVGAYLLLFAERPTLMTVQRIVLNLQRGAVWRALEALPTAPVVLVFALLCAGAVTMTREASIANDLLSDQLSTASFVIVGFGVRDAALRYLFAFSRRARRPEVVTMVYLALLYWIVPGVLGALGAQVLADLVLPPALTRPGFAAAVVAVQCGLAIALAAWRWNRNNSRMLAT